MKNQFRSDVARSLSVERSLLVALAGCKSNASKSRSQFAARQCRRQSPPRKCPTRTLPRPRRPAVSTANAHSPMSPSKSTSARARRVPKRSRKCRITFSPNSPAPVARPTVDAFNGQTPAGEIAMKNILVKIPGERPGIILLATHYDTKKLDNFVGADDGGSSTAVMLELARLAMRPARPLSSLDRVLRRRGSRQSRMERSRQPLRQPPDGGEVGT